MSGSDVTLSSDLRSQVHSLYSEHHRWLYNWLCKKLGSADAADLSHDTFIRMLSVPSLEEIREPRAFLTTVAHGLMVNHLRRKAIEQAYQDALATRPEAIYPGPEKRLIVLETLMQIDAMLDGLPVKVRQTFLLSQLEGLRYSEIAERLGVSLSMIKKYMLQAIIHCMHLRVE